MSDLSQTATAVTLAISPSPLATAEGESFTTLELHMSYFLPVVEGRLSAHAQAG